MYINKTPNGILHDAMLYAIGGKYVRPSLLLAVVKDLDGDVADAMPYAVALELIHSYSLVHDDLPCMDNDDYRRGKPSCHKAFGEANAVLTGDALLNLAYEIMCEAVTKNPVHSRVMSLIAKAAGADGMVLGQVLDMADNNGRTLEYTKNMYAHKTGALMKAALCAGALLSNVSDISEYEAMSGLVGYAFQLKDDILGVTSTFEQLGKTINNDEKNSKVTLVSLLGLETAEAEFTTVCNEIDSQYVKLNIPHGNTELRKILDSLRVRVG
jgi:geranylgeranyl diphosphate synthase type II